MSRKPGFAEEGCSHQSFHQVQVSSFKTSRECDITIWNSLFDLFVQKNWILLKIHSFLQKIVMFSRNDFPPKAIFFRNNVSSSEASTSQSLLPLCLNCYSYAWVDHQITPKHVPPNCTGLCYAKIKFCTVIARNLPYHSERKWNI